MPRGGTLKGLIMKHMLKRFLANDDGATAIEYGLIAALVALVGVVAFTALGETITRASSPIAQSLCEATGGEFALTETGADSCTGTDAGNGGGGGGDT